jgi:predicted aspartyl protease
MLTRRAVSGLARGVTVVAVAACSQVAGNGNLAGTSPTPPATTPSAAPSAAPSTARALPAAAVPIAVISYGQSQVELVPVYVDGHGPYAFLLDTGSSISSVSRQLAAGLGLRETGKMAQINGVATTSRAPLVSITDWRLGRYRLAPETVAALNIPGSSRSVAGLLGSDELRRFGEVTIDFRHLRLQFTGP